MKDNVKITISKEAFMGGLKTLNPFIDTKLMEGANMIEVKAIKDKNVLVMTGLGVDSSLISKTVSCENIEADIRMYINVTTTISRFEKIKKDVLEIEVIPSKRVLLVQAQRGIVSINVATDFDFNEDGSIKENKETVYAIGELPIRVVEKRKSEDVGEYGIIEVPLSKFKTAINAASVCPYPQVSEGCIKLDVKAGGEKLVITGSDGFRISLCEINDCKSSNFENGDVDFILKKDIVDKLSKIIEKVISSNSKKKKGAPVEEKIKILLGKSMIVMEMKDVSVICRKYQMTLGDVSVMFDVDFVWHGIVNVNDFKSDLDLILEAGSESTKKDESVMGHIIVNEASKILTYGLASKLGEGATCDLKYETIPGFESNLEFKKLPIAYNKLSNGLSLISDERALVRLHLLGQKVLLISFINEVSHGIHGLTYGMTIDL